MTNRLFHVEYTGQLELTVKYGSQSKLLPMALKNDALVSCIVEDKNWLLYNWDNFERWMSEEELLESIDYALAPKFDEQGAKELLRWVDELEPEGLF